MILVLSLSACSRATAKIQNQINNSRNAGMVDGQYHVYRTKDGVDEKVGSFDSVEEVNEAIGWNP